MGFWGLYLVALIIIISLYSFIESIIKLLSNKKMILPFIIGMLIGYLIFF
jgi:hypothetical protein